MVRLPTVSELNRYLPGTILRWYSNDTSRWLVAIKNSGGWQVAGAVDSEDLDSYHLCRLFGDPAEDEFEIILVFHHTT